jgi:hypothetical protein
MGYYCHGHCSKPQSGYLDCHQMYPWYLRGELWCRSAILSLNVLPTQGTGFQSGASDGDVAFGQLFRRRPGIRHHPNQSRNGPLEVAIYHRWVHILSHIKPSWLTIPPLEGLPTVLFSPVVFFLLPDSAGTAKFLNEQEQTEAVERLQHVDRTAKSKVNWTQFLAGVLDYRNVVHMLIHFCCNYSFAGLSNFLPTILKGMGYSSIDAQGLTAPVYLASFLLCVAVAFASDRYGQRGIIIAAFATMGCIGYLLLAIIEDKHATGARYCGVWLAVCGIFPALSINVSPSSDDIPSLSTSRS